MIQYCIKYPNDKVLPNEDNKCSLCGGNCTEEGQTYARKCSVTGEGMDEGWVTENTDEYFKYEQDALKWCKQNGYKSIKKAYKEEAIYWTEWQEDYQYIVKKGVLTEIEN